MHLIILSIDHLNSCELKVDKSLSEPVEIFGGLEPWACGKNLKLIYE